MLPNRLVVGPGLRTRRPRRDMCRCLLAAQSRGSGRDARIDRSATPKDPAVRWRPMMKGTMKGTRLIDRALVDLGMRSGSRHCPFFRVRMVRAGSAHCILESGVGRSAEEHTGARRSEGRERSAIPLPPCGTRDMHTIDLLTDSASDRVAAVDFWSGPQPGPPQSRRSIKSLICVLHLNNNILLLSF